MSVTILFSIEYCVLFVKIAKSTSNNNNIHIFCTRCDLNMKLIKILFESFFQISKTISGQSMMISLILVNKKFIIRGIISNIEGFKDRLKEWVVLGLEATWSLLRFEWLMIEIRL